MTAYRVIKKTEMGEYGQVVEEFIPQFKSFFSWQSFALSYSRVGRLYSTFNNLETAKLFIAGKQKSALNDQTRKKFGVKTEVVWP